jgi:hypothetical protein
MAMRYSRLFKRKFSPHSEQSLKDLADQMESDGDPNDLEGFPSGLVYFGQFIDHDLTKDLTKLDAVPYPEPEQTRNHRTPRFDLDSVYGGGPNSYEDIQPEDSIYEGIGSGAERLRIDPVDVAPSGSQGPVIFADIPRRGDATPVIPDARNDENLIISQIHVLFLRLHNRLTELLDRPNPMIPLGNGESTFNTARRLVTWHYQWLILNDFLPRIALDSVFRSLVCEGKKPRLFHTYPGQSVALPVEFTMAAFRFGHSMVRDKYLLNHQTSLQLPGILNFEARRLEANQVIDWPRFFGGAEVMNVAQKIDTTIAQGLYALSHRIVTLFRGGPGPSTEFVLPRRTLLRGSRVGLPSGQEACRKARMPPLDIDPRHRDYNVLKKSGMLKRTPLWYYLLYEAEIAGVDQTVEGKKGGHRLGLLGSTIVAEVILGVLRADKQSFIHQRWEPPALPIQCGNAQQTKTIRSLRDLGDFLACDSPLR